MSTSSPDSPRDEFPVQLIIDKMRDDYEGRHWADEDDEGDYE